MTYVYIYMHINIFTLPDLYIYVYLYMYICIDIYPYFCTHVCLQIVFMKPEFLSRATVTAASRGFLRCGPSELKRANCVCGRVLQCVAVCCSVLQCVVV